MDIDDNDPQVHYTGADWEADPQQRSNEKGPTVHIAHSLPASLSLQFTGTGVNVVGFVDDLNNFQDLLTCAVDDGHPVVPQVIMSDGAQSVTFCSITSLQNQPHTLTVTMGSNGVHNVLIDNFHIFSDSLHHPSTGTGSTSQKASNSGPMASSPPTPVRNTPQINLSTSHILRGSTPLSSKPSSLLSATTYLWRDPSVHTSLSQPRPPSASPHTAIIGSIVGGVVLLVVVISLLLCKLWKRRIRKEADPAPISDNTFIATPSIIRSNSTSAPLAEPSSQQGSRTSYTHDGPILADTKPDQFIDGESGSVAATDGHLILPESTRSIVSLDPPSSHTRLVHGEVLSTAWCAPTELQSRAQSLLRGFSAQQQRPSAMRDVDSGLRVYDEPALPPPYTPD